MTDHPMLFSAPMIRAQHNGTKTQTRRILTPRNIKLWSETAGRFMRPTAELLEGATREALDFKLVDGIWTWTAEPLPHQQSAIKTIWMGETPIKTGDRIWVKENFAPDPDSTHTSWDDHNSTYVQWSGCGSKASFIPDALKDTSSCIYAADPQWSGCDMKWSPSIHMPRWASRLTLLVTDARIERLQDISEADAIAEGVEPSPTNPGWWLSQEKGSLCPTARDAYGDLWNAINGDGAWQANPLVIAYTFTVHRQNIDQIGL